MARGPWGHGEEDDEEDDDTGMARGSPEEEDEVRWSAAAAAAWASASCSAAHSLCMRKPAAKSVTPLCAQHTSQCAANSSMVGRSIDWTGF